MIIECLYRYCIKEDSSARSNYYRYRSWLEKPLKSIAFADWWSDLGQELAEELASYGPLHPDDISQTKKRQLLEAWQKFLPKDPAFFEMLVRQHQLYMRLSELPLKDVIRDQQLQESFESRNNWNRSALFELDRDYRSSKGVSLERKMKVRQLLRENPLLRYKDIKALGVKNAQAQIESFPQLEWHRQNFLQKLKSTCDLD